MTNKQLTDDEWVARQKLEKEFMEEAERLFEKYGIINYKMCDDIFDYGCLLIWKNGLETNLSRILQ